MKKLLSLLALAALGACAEEPISRQGTNNPNIAAEYLFAIDGCKVYRFYDEGYARYLATCPGGAAQTSSEYRIQSGKTTIHRQTEAMTFRVDTTLKIDTTVVP